MFQTSSKCYDRAVLLWSRPIVLATTLPNKEGSWVLGLQGSVAKILQNPVLPLVDVWLQTLHHNCTCILCLHNENNYDPCRKWTLIINTKLCRFVVNLSNCRGVGSRGARGAARFVNVKTF